MRIELGLGHPLNWECSEVLFHRLAIVHDADLHVAHGIVECPFLDGREVAADMVGVQFWPGFWIAIDHVQREEADVCAAHDLVS